MSSTGHLSELDLLRSQVADLSRELAERDRAAQDLQEQSDLLRAIVEGTAAETGEEFFASLVTHLTSILHVQYAIIGEVQGDRIKKIHTLAVSAGGALVDNFEYDLTHTPCATALIETFAYFDRDLQATFPQFQLLADLGAESYCAVPLRTKSGAVIGLLVVMDTKPLQHSDSLQSLLGVFAPRIAAEFERKRAEQERAQAQADLHNVIETIPDVVFALNTQGNLVKWNRRLTVVTGYSPEELLNKSALAFVPPEEQASTAAAIQRVFTEGYAELEGHMQTKDHRLIPYHWTGALLKNTHGEPIGVIGVGRDVSDKKRAEEALRESEERLALAVDGSNDVLWDAQRLPGEPWYAPQTPVWWSSRVRELLGLQESDSFETFEQWNARLHPDDKNRVFSQLAAHIEHRVPYDIEYRLRTNAGDFRWIRGRGQALWDEEGEPRRMSGSCQDITEHKRAESLLLAVLNSTADGLLAVDREGKVTIANKRFLELWRIPKALLDRGDDAALLDFVLEQLQEPEAFLRRVQELYAHPEQESLDVLTFKDGRVLERYSRAQILKEEEEEEEEEEIVGRVWSFRDVTERYLAEESLKEMNVALTNAMPGISRVGLDGRYLAINEAYAGALGYDPSELIGEEAFRAVHPGDRPRMEAAHATMLQEGKGELEALALRKDGSTFWKQVLMVKILDREGRHLGHHCFMRDITERKWGQEALAQSERQLRTVLDALPLGVWFTDQSGKLLLGNPAAKQMWSNIKQIGLQGPNNQSGWWETIGPTEELHRWALSHTLTTGIPSLNETLEFESLDGTKRTIRNSTVPVKDETGNILGAIVLNEDITPLRQAQEALQLTQFSVDHAVEGFFWIGPDARIVHVNDAACQMLEYTREELTAMTLHDIDPNFPPEVWHPHWEELKEKGSLTSESKQWSRTGRVLDIEVTVNYLQYERKEYICAIMRDIGERKRGEAALRASEERYRVLYDETPTMYFTLATDGTVLSVNRFGAEQLGYQVDELIGHSVLGLFHEQDKEAVAAKLAECLATPEAIRHWEFRKVRKDGNIIWVQETVRVGQSSTGETVVLVTCEDMTERKRMEEALTFFRTLLDHVDDSIEIIDPRTGQFLDGNRGAAANIGYTRDEFLALTVPDIDPLVTRPVFAEMMERLQEAPDPIILDSIHRRKDGTTFPVEVSAQLIRLDKEYLVAIVRDITERKRAEHESHRRAEEALAMQRTLFEIARLDNRDLAFAEGVKGVTEIAAETLAVERVSLWLLSEDRTELVCQDLYERSQAVHSTGSRLRALNYPRYFSAIEDSLVVAASDALVDPRTSEFAEGYLLPLGIASMMDVAIRHQGTLIGVACYEHVGSPREWSPEAQSFAASVSDSVARILETAKRKQAEQALKESEQRLRDILDSMFAFVGLFSTDGILLEANTAPLIAAGLTREEVIGRPFAEAYWWSYSPAIQAELRAALSRAAQGEIVRYDVPVRIRNEQLITIDVAFAPLFNKQGQVTQIVGSAVDITDRKRMEETLRQRERALRAAIEEREQISQDLHDGILQSLFAVGLTLEVSKSMMSTSARKASGASLNQAIDQLNDVMREIRNFIAGLGSDLLQGKDFSAAVKHMLALLTQNQATRVRLAVEDRAAKAVSAEQSLHLFRVIQEAVSNCIRHGHAPEARVSLKMLKEGVRLSIRDNGRGFNPKAAKGTGHGLRNMAARAEKFGGRFTVLSKVNAGTRIVLDLPKEVSDVPR